jgi:hypothetical protein
LHQPIKSTNDSQKTQIPKVIIQFWHDLGNLPADVKECLNSWETLRNEGFIIKLFSNKSARVFIRNEFSEKYLKAFDKCHHPAMKCDYFRLCYIYCKGGFYVDADEVYTGASCNHLFSDNKLKIQPLCYDISKEKMVEPEIFLEDVQYPSNKIFYVNNNPLIGPPGHKLIKSALKRSTEILLNCSFKSEIQSTTGPGNLSASLVDYAINLKSNNENWDFHILKDWENISYCKWFLSYRNDERNWRLHNIQ